MNEVIGKFVQHPENSEMYFKIFNTRYSSGGQLVWDAFQIINNDESASVEALSVMLREGMEDPKQVSMIATQMIDGSIDEVRAKVVLHLPMVVPKSELVDIKDHSVSAGDSMTPFYANYIN